MKAIIGKPKRKILAANIEGKRYQLLLDAAKAHDAQVINVEDMNVSICSLLGETNAAKKDDEYPQKKDECLLFAGFDSGLNNLLDTLSSLGLNVPLKAAYTPHNRVWSFAHLMNEIEKEHRFMSGGGKK